MIKNVDFIPWAKKSHQRILSKKSHDQTPILELFLLNMVEDGFKTFFNNLGDKWGYKQR